MEPARQGVPPADGSGFLGEQQERSLESVFHILPRPQLPAADTQDEAAVPFDESGERGLVIAV
jgi:hypothetical protein